MKKVLLLLMLFPLFFGACSKDGFDDINKDYQPQNDMKKYNIEVTNESRHPYRFRLYIGDRVVDEITFAAGEVIIVDVETNKRYRWEALQLSGYLLYPTKDTGYFYSDRNRSIRFPED